MKRMITLWILIFLSYFAYAEQLKTDDGYEIQYNALHTQSLPAQMARAYQVLRSKTRGVLTVCVLKIGEKPQLLNKSVPAQVTAQAVNLNNQLKTIVMRPVQEGNAIYHIGEFSLSNEESLTFTLHVIPESRGKPRDITFTQQFFVD